MSDEGHRGRTEQAGPGCNGRESPQPNRVLGLWDVTLLGVGSVLATGIYLFTGQIFKELSGPSVMVSYVIASVVCSLTGKCLQETKTTTFANI